MKTFYTILKVLAALAAIAGVVYIVATYGDKIVAWARNLLRRNKRHECDGECDCCDADCEEFCEESWAEFCDDCEDEFSCEAFSFPICSCWGCVLTMGRKSVMGPPEDFFVFSSFSGSLSPAVCSGFGFSSFRPWALVCVYFNNCSTWAL